MKMTPTRILMLLACCAISCIAAGLSSCEESPAPVTTLSGADVVLTHSLSFDYHYTDLTVNLPDGWTGEVIPPENEDSNADYCIRFWPEEDPTAVARISYVSSFGVCGTELETEVAQLPGGTEIRLYSWGGKTPSLARYEDAPDTFTASWSLDEDQREAYYDTLLTIIDHAETAGEVASRSEFLDFCGVTDDTRIRAEFDHESGVWTAEIYKEDRKTIDRTVSLSPDGMVSETIYCYAEEPS